MKTSGANIENLTVQWRNVKLLLLWHCRRCANSVQSKASFQEELTQKDNLLRVCWTRINGLDVLPREDNKEGFNKAKKDLAQHMCTLQQTLYRK